MVRPTGSAERRVPRPTLIETRRVRRGQLRVSSRPASLGGLSLLSNAILSIASLGDFLWWAWCILPGAHALNHRQLGVEPREFHNVSSNDYGLEASTWQSSTSPHISSDHPHQERRVLPRDVLFSESEQCTRSPLWEMEVDPAGYELGCTEVERMLDASDTRQVGKGAFRDVYLAEYGDRTVALKLLKSQRFTPNHHIEVVTLNAVKGHPNIVQMIGFCNTTLVTEAFGRDIQYAVTKRSGRLPLRDAVLMSLDVARGAQALHEAATAPIVHNDLKPTQMLVADDGQVKLNDFNMAYFMSTRPDGSPCPFRQGGKIQQGPWRSPEYLSGQSLTEKMDIYRAGLVFRKYLAHGGVHGHDNHEESASSTPDFDISQHKTFDIIVRDMTAEDPELRPSARQVVSRLEVILEGM